MNATLCLSFDNLGEAAEVGAGTRDAAGPFGGHPTVTSFAPAILEALAARGLKATFFVEGLNAEVYPDLLKRIDGAGHEVAYHAWTHEQWGGLSAAEQTENLARGCDAFASIGLEVSGLRPPGGSLSLGGVEVVRRAGLSYCSPAGRGIGYRAAGSGAEDGVALLPFSWQHVDVTCVMPQLSSVRKRMTGSDGEIAPDRFLAHLEAEAARLADQGGFATFILHPFMLDWLGIGHLEALLDRLAAASASGELSLATCREVAGRVLADPDGIGVGFELDQTTWSV